MKFLIVDESDAFKKRKITYLVIGGYIIGSDELFRLEKHLRYFSNTFLNGSPIRSLRKREWGRLKLKLSEKLYSDLTKEFNLKIITTIIGEYSTARYGRPDNYTSGLRFLIERFFFDCKTDGEEGLVLADELEQKTQSRIAKSIYDFIMTECKREGKLKNHLLPQPAFWNDKYSFSLQLADLFCSGLQNAVYRFVTSHNVTSLKGYEDKLVNYNHYLKLYWPLIRESPHGKKAGWGIKVWD